MRQQTRTWVLLTEFKQMGKLEGGHRDFMLPKSVFQTSNKYVQDYSDTNFNVQNFNVPLNRIISAE